MVGLFLSSREKIRVSSHGFLECGFSFVARFLLVAIASLVGADAVGPTISKTTQ